jgi:hypothetical protein
VPDQLLDKMLSKDALKGEFELLAKSLRQMSRQSAADIFDGLAASVADIPEDIFAEHQQLFDDLRGLDCYDEMLLDIGVAYFPATAERFLRDFIAKQSGAPNVPAT